MVVSRLALPSIRCPADAGDVSETSAGPFWGGTAGSNPPVPKTVADTLQSPTSQSTEWDQPQFASDASEDAARIPPRGDGLSVQ